MQGMTEEYHGNPAGTVSPRRFEEGDFPVPVKVLVFETAYSFIV
jgi:hypothetical protein